MEWVELWRNDLFRRHRPTRSDWYSSDFSFLFLIYPQVTKFNNRKNKYMGGHCCKGDASTADTELRVPPTPSLGPNQRRPLPVVVPLNRQNSQKNLLKQINALENQTLPPVKYIFCIKKVKKVILFYFYECGMSEEFICQSIWLSCYQ